MNRIRLASLGAGMIMLLSGHALHAQGWGTLKARFVLDGEAPKVQPVEITKDEAYCG